LFLGLACPASGKIVYRSSTGTKRGRIATTAIAVPAESQRVVTIAEATNDTIMSDLLCWLVIHYTTGFPGVQEADAS
jgi:hypothetical protein